MGASWKDSWNDRKKDIGDGQWMDEDEPRLCIYWHGITFIWNH